MAGACRRAGARPVFTEDVLRAIPRWFALGADKREIAEVLGTTVGSLEYACSREGISLSGGAVSNLTLQRGLRPDEWLRLRREAQRREVPVAQLVVDLVSVIVRDDMFDAVLDDAYAEEARACAAR